MINEVLCHHKYGVPEEVITLEKRPLSALGPKDILVETHFAPINPAEINLLEGKYGRLRPLPVIPGYDSAGIVLEIGSEVSKIAVGDHVIAPQVRGSWCRYRVIDERYAFIVPDNIPLEQASMLNVNPMTALVLLSQYKQLERGAWIIQNASNSGVGRAVIDIANHKGYETINIVRREELVDEIKKAGGTIVATQEQVKEKKLKAQTEMLTISLGINSVGGESARLLARQLSDQGVMVTIGAMSKEPVIIDNSLLIFKNIVVTGFWRSKWLEVMPQETISKVYREVIDLAAQGAFRVPIEAIYPFAEASAAIAHAQKSQRWGKVLLSPRPIS